MLAGSNITESLDADVPVKIFLDILKQYPQLPLMANLSVTIKSNQCVGKKVQDALFLEKT